MKLRRRVPKAERGIALLSVLLMVAVMAIITTIVLDRVNLAVHLAGNQQLQDRSRLAARGLEMLAAGEIKRRQAASQARTVDTGWVGQTQLLPLNDGSDAVANVVVRDGGNCFNLNSVVQGAPGSQKINPIGIDQFVGLVRVLGGDTRIAQPLALALADWIDSDSIENPGGAEDAYYQRLEKPYRTAATLMVDKAEIRAVRGMTPQLYARLEPWLCTLPDAILSPINVNTLTPAQAPLVMMLASDKIDLQRARRAIEARPTDGYPRIADFWRAMGSQSLDLPSEVESQPQLVTRWFDVDMSIELDGARYRQTSLIDVQLDPPRVISRRIGEP